MAGGRQRQDSVHNGIAALADDCELVVIHDAARPFVTPDLIARAVEGAAQYGAVAAGIVALARLALPEEYRLVGMLTALPFLGIAAMAGWKQLRSPSAARVASTLEATAALSWREFNDALEEAFRHDGYAVTRLGKPAADFEMVKAGRTSLVSCKRWKAASTGVEPLRELHAAGEARASDQNV